MALGFYRRRYCAINTHQRSSGAPWPFPSGAGRRVASRQRNWVWRRRLALFTASKAAANSRLELTRNSDTAGVSLSTDCHLSGRRRRPSLMPPAPASYGPAPSAGRRRQSSLQTEVAPGELPAHFGKHAGHVGSEAEHYFADRTDVDFQNIPAFLASILSSWTTILFNAIHSAQVFVLWTVVSGLPPFLSPPRVGTC